MTQTKTVEDVIETLASGWRNWTHDQLDGTSYIKDELDEIERTKAEALADLKALMESVKPPKWFPTADPTELIHVRAAGYNDAIDDFTAALTKLFKQEGENDERK